MRSDSGEFDEAVFERHLAIDQRKLVANCCYWLQKLQARFHAENIAAAIDASRQGRAAAFVVQVHFSKWPNIIFIARSAMRHLSSWIDTECVSRNWNIWRLHHRQTEVWANQCPENFENQAALVGAEVARIEGRELEAERLYECAIHSARTNGFLNNEAVANELAARFHASRGFETIANAYLREAMSCYRRWGAEGKVRQLECSHPHLRETELAHAAGCDDRAQIEHLDFATVIKVSQALSGEMVAGEADRYAFAPGDRARGCCARRIAFVARE